MKTTNASSGLYVVYVHALISILTVYPCQQFENSLRRHNHIGFIHALLTALAKAGKLEQAKENAKKVMSERRAKKGGSAMDED